MIGWLVTAPQWISLGVPTKQAIISPYNGPIMEKLTWMYSATRVIEAIFVVIDEADRTEIHRLASSFMIHPGDNLNLSIERPLRP